LLSSFLIIILSHDILIHLSPLKRDERSFSVAYAI